MHYPRSKEEEEEDEHTKDGVNGVHGDLVLGSIADETLSIGERDIGRGGSVPLIIGYDLYTIVLPHSNTGICRAQVDTDRRAFTFSDHDFLSLNNQSRKTKKV